MITRSVVVSEASALGHVSEAHGELKVMLHNLQQEHTHLNVTAAIECFEPSQEHRCHTEHMLSRNYNSLDPKPARLVSIELAWRR
jgi:hypothetical protein